MKKILLILFFFILTSCSNNKMVYWCGDHACVNKAEREAYFKKNMTIEMREIKKNKTDKKLQALSEKKFKKEEKERIKEEKRLKKLAKLEEKRKKKEEKKLKKEIIKEEKVTLKRKKKLIKNETKSNQPKIVKSNNDKVDTNISKSSFSQFDEFVKFIMDETKSSEYPDINTVPD
tara:strand:+ start:469 stop:993 length:525 start_codon:yes stop_codon:yes gene_type:complete